MWLELSHGSTRNVSKPTGMIVGGSQRLPALGQRLQLLATWLSSCGCQDGSHLAEWAS